MSGAQTYIFTPRIIRSPESDCWGDDLGTALRAYTEDYLREIAQEGYDGLWLHLCLRDTIPSSLFPAVRTKRLDLLNRLVERAARHGVRIYVYLNEPRGLHADHPFWKGHPGLMGQPAVFAGANPAFSGEFRALCTSTAAVREYLEESCRKLFCRVPGLGGTFLITASELHTHCYSHFAKHSSPLSEFHCPRCIERDPVDVVAELIAAVNRGVKSAAPDAEVMAWTWSWSIIEPDPQENLIRRLPRDVTLMSDWERGGSKRVLGKSYPVDEYSFSSLGPSPRFKRQLALGKRRGMKVMAKIQIGTTHELATIPYLPVPPLLAEKLNRMRKCGVDGYLGCWNIGGEISEMTRLAGRISRRPALSPAQALRKLSREEFGPANAGEVVKAWRHFADAWRQYPFSQSVIYCGPMNYAPACPIHLDLQPHPEVPLARPAHEPQPRDKNGRLAFRTSPEAWLGPFGAEITARAFGHLLTEWRKGLRVLRAALAADTGNGNLERELNLAEHVALSVRSTLHIIRLHQTLWALRKAKAPKARSRLRSRLARILEADIAVAAADRKVIVLDPRLGYHSEAFTRLFSPEDLDHKIRALARAVRTLKTAGHKERTR